MCLHILILFYLRLNKSWTDCCRDWWISSRFTLNSIITTHNNTINRNSNKHAFHSLYNVIRVYNEYIVTVFGINKHRFVCDCDSWLQLGRCQTVLVRLNIFNAITTCLQVCCTCEVICTITTCWIFPSNFVFKDSQFPVTAIKISSLETFCIRTW